MYQIEENTYGDYRINCTAVVKYDEWEEAYTGETIEDSIILRLIRETGRLGTEIYDKESNINVKPDNINKLISDIKNCSYQFTTPNSETLNLNDINSNSKELINRIKAVQNTIERLDFIDPNSIDNILIIGKETIIETSDYQVPILSKSNSFDYIVLFGGIPISFELLNKGDFNFENHIEEYDDFITCQYCGNSGYIEGYQVTGNSKTSFNSTLNEICKDCADKIDSKTSKINDGNKKLEEELITQKI
jgi:hypothetical protein